MFYKLSIKIPEEKGKETRNFFYLNKLDSLDWKVQVGIILQRNYFNFFELFSIFKIL